MDCCTLCCFMYCWSFCVLISFGFQWILCLKKILCICVHDRYLMLLITLAQKLIGRFMHKDRSFLYRLWVVLYFIGSWPYCPRLTFRLYSSPGVVLRLSWSNRANWSHETFSVRVKIWRCWDDILGYLALCYNGRVKIKRREDLPWQKYS